MPDKIDETLRFIKIAFAYLFDEYGYQVVFIRPEYGYFAYGVAIGVHSEKMNFHLLFMRESI